MGKRKSLSSKKRFAILERDNFTCQYCGATPPDAVLQVDHITPFALGGDNETDNLITSCRTCNNGKASAELKAAPPAIKQNKKDLEAREDEVKQQRELVKKKTARFNRYARQLEKIYQEHYPDLKFKRGFKNSLHTFFDKLTIRELKADMYKACEVTHYDVGALKYFCGICWNKIKQKDTQ